MPQKRFARPFTAAVLSALLAGGILETPEQAAAHAHQRSVADKPERVRGVPAVLKRKDVPISRRQGGSSTRVSAPDGTQSSLVAAPTGGSSRSTWRVTCNGALGFDSSPPCLRAKAPFQAAVAIWSKIVASPITINLDVSFAALPTSILGSAYSPYFYKNAAGTTLHASALADALQGRDIALQDYGVANDPDIVAQFTTSSSVNYYYGTDGAAAADQVDFQSVVLHELGHGLGFASSMKVDTSGLGSYGAKEDASSAEPFKPYAFDRHAVTAQTGGSRLIDLAPPATPSAALGSALRSGSVYWSGARGVSAAGVRPRLYAPSTWDPGSSFAHLDEATFGPGNANSLMTPFLSKNEAVHNPGYIAVGMLADQGWVTHLAPDAPGAPTGVTAAPVTGGAQVSWNPAPGNGSAVIDYDVYASTSTTANVLVCDNVAGLTCAARQLSNDTAYTFRVTARNAVGTSPMSQASAPVTPSGADTTAPTVTFTSRPPDNTNLTSATFGFTAADPARANARLTLTCQLDSLAIESGPSCSSPKSYSGLADGTHTFTVRATDEAGNVGTAQDTWRVDTGVPTVTLSAKPAVHSRSSSASFTFSATDPGRASALLVYSCQLDAAAPAPCSSPAAVSGLVNGSHTFTVRATDEAGNVGAARYTWQVDTVRPAVTTRALPVFTLASSVGVTFDGSDVGGSGIASFKITTSRTSYSGTVLTPPAPITRTTKGSVSFTTTRGATYCFTVLVTDRAGNSSSSKRCTASALDDRHLSASTGWTRATNAYLYAGTYSTAARTGVTLTRTSVRAKRISIVATKCNGCGTVGIYLNGVLQKQISLNNGGATLHKQVIPVIAYSAARRGTLTIKTWSSKRVYVDGLGISQV
jgi:hypothetical protein